MRVLIGIILTCICYNARCQTIRVGSKHFTEGYILSEIISQVLEENGFNVTRRYNLGGTMVCFEALRNDEIDIYPEYSGTLSAEILREHGLGNDQIRAKLQKQYALQVSGPFGFSNSYALVCSQQLSSRLGLKRISDLRGQRALQLGFSYEFLNRQDGWNNLKERYQLSHQPVGLEHGLAYDALQSRTIDITDANTTDGEVLRYQLVVLEDDLHFFPNYEATSLYREQLPEKAKAVLSQLNGLITDDDMRSMNAEVSLGHKAFEVVASDFLLERKLIHRNGYAPESTTTQILLRTLTHIELTVVALILAMVVAIPLAIALYWKPLWANAIIYVAGLLQTIPTIALLAVMIPLFGIGVFPAIVALFLYALLPILRNTVIGLQTVDPLLKHVGEGLGMSRYQRLKYIELPLATPAILAGIRTAAVINVGTATLAAFIGAGGLGEFIVSGLALNNTTLILRGAIPAAMLALLVEFSFALLERWIVPRHLSR